MIVRTATFAVVLFISWSTPLMSNSAPPTDAVSVIAQEFLVDDPCALQVHVPGAHTTLRPGAAGDRLEVDVSVTGCPPDQAEAVLDRLEVSTRQKKDTIHVQSEADRSDATWWRWVRTLDVTVHVDLRVPSTVDADLTVHGGLVEVADLSGQFDIDVSGGPCRLHNLDGTLDLRAESSEVEIDGFSGDRLEARVAVGRLTLTDVAAESIVLRPVAAPLSATDVRGDTTITANSTPVTLDGLEGTCTARSQGAPIEFTTPPTGEADLTVVGADLTVTLPSDHGAALRMEGASVHLDEAFPFEGDRTPTELTGTLNQGGPALHLRSVGGTVECRSS
jgi:hypothetical protein